MKFKREHKIVLLVLKKRKKKHLSSQSKNERNSIKNKNP